MSSTSGSLVGYENNNDIRKMKKRRPSAEICKAGSSSADSRKQAKCASVHLNNLWSLWYGIFGSFLQAYTAVKCIKRILGYSVLTWPATTPLPILEMNTSLGLTGAAVLLLPFFLASAVFKIGNLANDGFKLGRQLSTCSKESPKDTLDSGGGCGVWKHGGPTAPFLHLVIAFCLLLPKLLMEARLIEAGLLPQESIWRTDLDFMVVHRDRLVVLSFMTSTNNTFNHKAPTPLLTADIGNLSLPESTPAALAFTHTVVKTLRDYLGHEDHHQNLQNSVETGWGSSVSVEYLNFALSLLVYSVRYPALFWSTNKCMGLLFSFQLLINGLQTLLAYAGMSVLYKVQIIGAWKSLPLLKHQPRGASPLSGDTPFLLNPQVTLALYILSLLLVLSSSLVLYLYGHTRFNSFLNQERERKVIMLKEGGHSKWGYFTHCAALCVLVSVGICNAPLLHDYTIVYKGSLDGAILACVIGGILHLFLWVVVWLFLTIKQKWIFKLRVSVGRATVRQARSVKLVTEIDLMTNNPDDQSSQPLLVVGNGRTYTINEISPKKAIMGVIQKATMIKKVKSEHGGSTTNDENDEEQIYWLRPALVTPQQSPDGSKQLCWFNKKPKHKVTFNETNSTSISRNKGNSTRRRLPGMEVDDGDYATLRQLPLPPPNMDGNITDDNVSEEGKLLACVHDEHVTYASTSQDLVPPVDYEDPSPLLTPEPLDKIIDHHPIHHQTPISVIVHNHQAMPPTGLTPRCLRRADSGMPHEELTPRSDSISTESSSSPPDPPGSNHSETSSGIHSNESSENPQFNTPQPHQPATTNQQTRRATSVADLQHPMKDDVQWKSCSLQRNVGPPTSASFAQNPHFVNSPSSNSVYGYCNQNYVNTAELDHNIILENPDDDTVVIRRKTVRPKTVDITQTPTIKEDIYGRATNIRMTSFTEDLKNITASSATLPHYPTQPVPNTNNYPQCNTMPLPQHTSNNIPANLGGGASCNVYPRQHTTIPNHHTTIPNHHTSMPNHHTSMPNQHTSMPNQHTSMPNHHTSMPNHHSTIPTHHNGVRLFNASSNPYIKRLQCQNGPIRYNSINEPIYTGVNRQTGEIYHYNS